MSLSVTSCRADPRFVGDPIDVTTGANTDIITDVAQRGPLPFRWTRYYSSARATVSCSLGWGHSHHFDRVLIRDLDGMRYQDSLGGAVPFSVPTLNPVQAGGMELKWRGADTYVISKPGQPKEVFQFTPGSDSARLIRLASGDVAIELRYDPGGSLDEIVDSTGRLIRVVRDSAGHVVKLTSIDPRSGSEGTVLLTYEYDRAGNLVRATDRYNTTLSFSYDAGNRMTRRTDRRGYSFHFKYDDEGRCIHSLGDDGLLEVFLDYHPDAGTTFVRRGDGGQWIYHYNDNKTITQITDPYGNATKFILDEFGRPVLEIDPNGNITQLHYDRFGRHDFRVDPNGHVLPTKADNPNPPDPLAYKLPKTALQWDLGSLVDEETIATPFAHDPLLADFPAPVIDTVLGRTTTYDAAALPQATVHGAEKLLQNDFDQFLEITTPSLTQRWKYDANGNLIEHQDRDGSVYRYVVKSWNARGQSIDPLGNVTSFDFNTQGLVSKVTDPGGTVTEYRYDLRDLPVEVHENGELRETYHWDRAGNIVQKDDNLGRTLVKWEVGAGNVYKTDILGSGQKHPFEHDATGRIIKAETSAGAATFLYDDDGHLLADKRDGMGVSHQFEQRQLRCTTYFDKFKVSYEKPPIGGWIIQDPTGARHRFQIGKTGLVVKNLANGSRELSQFDRDGRCRRKALIHNNWDSALWMRGYAYSAMGDLLTVADTTRGATKYRHDAAHRLIEEVRPGGHARRFQHDATGNLLEQPGLKDVVIEEANRLKEANGERFAYNHRGDISERQGPNGTTTRYEYDAQDTLVRCDASGEPWTATYDGLRRRVQKTWRGETTTYYWDDFRLAAEVRQDGSCRLYIYADDVALAPFLFIEYGSLDAEPESGKRYYVFTNQIGAPIRVEDDAGKVCWNAQIDPYGAAHIDQGNTIDMPLRFPGHYFDQETGLHCNRFRYFSPELGRYIQSDPAGQSGGINIYAYLHNPLSDVDVDGLASRVKGNGTKPRFKKGPGSALPPGCPLQKLTDEEMKPENLQAALEERARLMHNQLQQGDVRIPGPPPYTLSGNRTTQAPCLSVVVDKKGNVFFGQNTGDFPDNMNKDLAGRALDQAARGMPKTDVGSVREGASQLPGTHAEVHAVNRAQAANPGTPLSDLTVHNVSTTEKDDKGKVKVRGPVEKTDPPLKSMPCCSNCSGVLNADDGKRDGSPGVNTTEPPEDRDGFLR